MQQGFLLTLKSLRLIPFTFVTLLGGTEVVLKKHSERHLKIQSVFQEKI